MPLNAKGIVRCTVQKIQVHFLYLDVKLCTFCCPRALLDWEGHCLIAADEDLQINFIGYVKANLSFNQHLSYTYYEYKALMFTFTVATSHVKSCFRCL